MIQPEQVRYIKLGSKGKWETECREKGIIRYGYESASAERFSLCQAADWEGLTQSFITQGKSKGTAKNFTNQTRFFVEDDGSTLWITFIGERLFWGFLDGAPLQRHVDGDGVWRRVVGGWQYKDINGEELTKDRLSGALTKLASYRGTSCGVGVSESKYVIQRINGRKLFQVEAAVAAIRELKSSVLELFKLLGPKDFELLVGLVFSSSGWRRLGDIGKTQKTLDIDLVLPSTGERAFVQVKSSTNQQELSEYVGKLSELGPYDRMFFVHHTGEVESDDDRVTVIGPEKLAELVIDAGLVNWLVQKVS